MTYGDRMPTPEAAGAVRPRAATIRTTAAADCGGPVVTADRGGVPAARSEAHELDGVRLEVDWILGDVDPEFALGRRSLDAAAAAAGRLAAGVPADPAPRHSDYQWTTDPGNPRRVPNPFGEKSEIRFPDYREPNWLLTEPAGPLRWIETPAGRLDAAGAGAAVVAARAGRRHARRRCCSCTTGRTWPTAVRCCRWATAMSRELPIRVALLDPPNGCATRGTRPNPDYSDHLADVVLPALTRTGADRTGDRARAPAWARSRMLALQRRHPGSISALALQSGSFFTQEPRRRRRAATRTSTRCAPRSG